MSLFEDELRNALHVYAKENKELKEQLASAELLVAELNKKVDELEKKAKDKRGHYFENNPVAEAFPKDPRSVYTPASWKG